MPAPESPFRRTGRWRNVKWLLWPTAVVLVISSALVGMHFVPSTAENRQLAADHKDPGTLPPLAGKSTAKNADTTPLPRQAREVVRIDPPSALPAAANGKHTDPARPRDLEPIPLQLGVVEKKRSVIPPHTKDRNHPSHGGGAPIATMVSDRPEDSDAQTNASSGVPSDEIEPFYRKALTNHREGRLAEALRLYRKVLAADPNHEGAMMNLAAIALAQADYRQAQTLLTRLAHRQPRPKGVLLNLAIAAIGIGDHSTALAYLDRAGQESDAPTWDIRFHRAVAYSQLNRPQDALALYEAVMAERPDDPRLRFNLAVTYDRLGDYEKALPHYEAAVHHNGASPKMDEAAITRRIRTLRRHLDETRQGEKGQ